MFSHGQSGIQGGFSVYSNMEVENLKEQNPVALKMVNSELQNTSPNIAEYSITSEIVRSCKETRQRNQEHLESEKKKEDDIQKH